jgi:UDP-hydrolysing UDP-N-acetyl-D-glucosamine 2-epimerase
VSLIATGTHCSSLHGDTIQLIENDGIEVAHEVRMTSTSDTEDAICLSIATGLSEFSKLFAASSPDLFLVLGDRYELWSACIAAAVHKIPIAHIHGGEATFGLIDDAVRNSVTKMSALHFVSIDLYAQRIIQMGESPEKVFVVGAMGLDSIKELPLMSVEELSEYSGVDFEKHIALMTYHPVTLDNYSSTAKQIQEVFNSLIKTDLQVLITMPNADASGHVIYKKCEEVARRYPGKFKLIRNLGQRGYLSAMKYARLMVGNSSSGVIESASFKLPVVNIGDRQAGRFKPCNVIDCVCEQDAISDAIERASSEEFRQSLDHLENPYGDGNAANRIAGVLESMDFHDKSQLLKKGFYDLETELSQVKIQRMV